MTTYNVFYQREMFPQPHFNKVAHVVWPDVHIYVGSVEAENLDDAFEKMQGEFMSDAQAADIAAAYDTISFVHYPKYHHTSLSIGDVLFDTETKTHWIVEPSGFRRLFE